MLYLWEVGKKHKHFCKRWFPCFCPASQRHKAWKRGFLSGSSVSFSPCRTFHSLFCSRTQHMPGWRWWTAWCCFYWAGGSSSADLKSTQDVMMTPKLTLCASWPQDGKVTHTGSSYLKKGRVWGPWLREELGFLEKFKASSVSSDCLKNLNHNLWPNLPLATFSSLPKMYAAISNLLWLWGTELFSVFILDMIFIEFLISFLY